MKKTLFASLIALLSAGVNAELIQHTDQISEVKFTGSTYELGKHVGEVAKDDILDSISRFDDTLGVMLPGLNVASLGKSYEGEQVFENLQQQSPEAASYIKGLSESLNLPPSFLLAVGMSDEAILESQRNGGIGFLQAEAPAKCSVMGMTDGEGKGWGVANFDYMAVNYEGLIVLNHTDEEGNTKVIQTWAGLIPYGGIAKGGQPLLMNTMADEGTYREKDGGDILKGNAPSYVLSWDAYNATSPDQLLDMYRSGPGKYSAYFSYVMLDPNGEALNVENGYQARYSYSYSQKQSHANHSKFVEHDFVDSKFAAKTLDRQAALDEFMASATAKTTQDEAVAAMHSKPLWKGRGELMGTVTTTHYQIDGNKVDMTIYTDSDHEPVVIKNY